MTYTESNFEANADKIHLGIQIDLGCLISELRLSNSEQNP